MTELHLRAEDCLSDEEADSLMGKLLTEGHARVLVREDADVYKPDGSLLLRFRRGALPHSLCKLSHKVFFDAATKTDNRGVAAGMDTLGQLRKPKVKKDGTVSRQTRSVQVNSGIVGYTEAMGGRFPYCRMTAFNLHHGHEFAEGLPFIQKVSDLFRDLVPDRWHAQKNVYDQTSEDFRIPNSVFTTVTVNRNWQTAVHKDAGDLKEGFGVLTAVRTADIQGCYLCFPKYKVAVDLRTTDLLCCDVHEWHGNTPLTKQTKNSYRLSFVFYYRQRLGTCGSAEQELEKAKARVPVPGRQR